MLPKRSYILATAALLGLLWATGTAAWGQFSGQNVIADTLKNVVHTTTADLTGNGRPGVLVGRGKDGNHRLTWIENSDSGFQDATIIGSGSDGAHEVGVADVDGDGDRDVLAASGSAATLSWYENQGSGTFGDAQVIDGSLGGRAQAARSADLDGDGDPDVLSSDWGGVYWYENQGGSFGSVQTIGSYDDADEVAVADLTGDGRPDVIGGAADDGEIAWHENQGDGSFGGKQQITTAAVGIDKIDAADVDGDGDLDLLSASSGGSSNPSKIAWYENQGGSFGGQQVIGEGDKGGRWLVAADFDGDGLPDLGTAGAEADTIGWRENTGGGFGGFQVVTTNVDRPRAVAAADLNENGRLDLVSASSGDQKSAWYKSQFDDSDELASTAWPTYGHDLHRTGRSPNAGPASAQVLWTASAVHPNNRLNEIALGPDGTIYTGANDTESSADDNQHLYAFKPDGTLKWTYNTLENHSSDEQGDVSAAPTVRSDGVLYVSSNSDHLHAVNPDSTRRWATRLHTQSGMPSSPAIADDSTVYVGTNAFELDALDPEGNVLWTTSTDGRPRSPAIASDGTIYLSSGNSDGQLAAFSPAGNKQWSYDLGGRAGDAPTVGPDGTIYVGSGTGALHAVRSDGTSEWTFETGGGVRSSPSIGPNGTIYVGSEDNYLYALNQDGTLKWKYQTGGDVGAPAVGGDGRIYVGSRDSTLYALESDGSLAWSVKVDAPIIEMPVINSTGQIYITAGIKVYAIGASDLPASEDVVYVDEDASGSNDGSSWSDAYVRLQDAFDRATRDSAVTHEIWVAEGTYYPDRDEVDNDGDGTTEHTEGSRTESFTVVNDNVELYGGFSGGESARSDRDPSTNEVVLSGDIGAASDTSDNSYNVLYVDGTTGPDITKNTTLDGVTVEKGVARGNFPNGDGGGLFCDAGGSGNRCAPVIENVVFRENVAVFGGAIFNNGTDIDAEKTATAKTSAVRSDGNRLHIDRREKSDASRGSRAASDGAHPKLTDVVFRDNKADGSGGAIYNWGDQGAAGPQISNSQFVGNVAESWGGAIMSDGSPGQSNPVIQNTMFDQNRAQTGGAVLLFAGIGGTVSPEVRGAVFSRNEAEYGGAVQIFSDSTDANGNSSEARPLFRDVTFSQNRATGATDDAGNPVSDGGALRTWAIDEAVAEPTVVNGIFTGNTATRDGGALHNVVATDVNGGVVQPTIANGIFAGNAADKNGGAVHNLGGDSGSASPVLSNVILWNNDGNADGDDLGADNEMFSANSSAQPAIRYSIIEGGAAAVEDVGDASTTYDESNLDQNPQFAAVNGGAGSDATYGTSDDDLRLQGPGSPNGASPAIDAGDNAALDLDGDGTIDVSQDVAAQDRRLDVEDVSDTGNGSPPIVDMGAHESDGSALRSGSPSPDAPSSLTAVSAADSVSLRWTSSDSADVAWYRVYRDTQPIDSTAGPSSYAAYDSTAAGDTTFTDINIQVDTAYYYRVTAIDTARNESGFSPGAQATPASQRSLAVTSLRPSSGAPGTTVRIRGVGFDPTPSNNTVTFGGTEATLNRATSTVLYARVPSGVSGPVEVSVSHEEMAARATGQFTVVTKGGDSFAVSRADLTGVSNASIAWGDYNSDGDLDLAVAGANASGNPTTKIYRNEGNGQFTAVGAGLTDVRNASVAWGDYDRDGDRDLAVAGEDANENPVTQIYRNEGNGQFTAVGAGLTDVSNASLAWGDYNNDGYLDLVVAGYGSTHTTKLYRNEGNGTFSTVGADLEGMSSGSTAWGDIDGDGDLDLVVVGQGETVPNVDPYGLEAKIYRNEGNGIFSTVGAGLTDVGEGSVAWGDYDGDGDLDLAFAGYERIGPTRFTRVYRNEGGGTFTVAGTDMMGVRNSSVHWGDVDGDGDLDLAVAGTDTTGEPSTTVYRNKGGEDFSPLGVGFPGVSSASVDWGDVDSDGDLDLAVAGSDGGSPSATIYENGTGEAAAPQSPTTLTATPAQGEVELSWNDVQALDLKSYRVYRDTEPFDTTEGPDAYSALTTVPAGQTTVTDSSPPSGTSVYYRVTAVDEDGNESSFSKGAVRYLDEMTADVRQVFGDPTEKENFELIGLPGRESVSLNTALPGRSPDDWRAFGWNGSFVEADASDDFEPGEGFWILAREAFSVDRSVEPVSLNEQGAYQIDLRNDWNLISNPFDVDVSWERIQRANGLDAALWQWDGRWKQVSTFTSAAEGTAFYVHNRANLDALSVPYPGLSTLGKNQAAQDKNTEDGSRLRLMAGRREQTNTMVQVLWNEGASEGIDTYDRFAPPGRFQPVRLRLQADSADIPLAVEARPAPSAEGRRYEMTLHAPAGTPVHVRVDRLSSFPAKNAVLVRRKTGEAFPLSGGSPVEITPRSASSQWVLLLGDQGYVEREMKALAPESVQLHPNYPNPVQQSTTFRYGLPDGQHVHLAIYDVLGRRVQVLVDGDQSAGIHTVRWQGRARGGERVASGVYFVRLRTDQQTKTRKMVVVR